MRFNEREESELRSDWQAEACPTKACPQEWGRPRGHPAQKATLPRVGFHRQGLRVGAAGDGQLHYASARWHPLALRAGGVLVDGGDRVLAAATAAAARWGCVEIPDETVHTGRGPERLEGPDPVGRDIDRRVWGLGFVLAGETAHQFARGVEDVERDCRGWGGLQVVIDDGAIGWVLSAGLFGGQRRIGIGIARIAPGRAGREEVRGRGGGLGGQLAERGDIVENPEAAAVRA